MLGLCGDETWQSCLMEVRKSFIASDRARGRKRNMRNRFLETHFLLSLVDKNKARMT